MNEKEIVQKALTISDADERSSYVEVACGKDVELRSRVEALIISESEESNANKSSTNEMGSAETLATIVDNGREPVEIERDVEASTQNEVEAILSKYLSPSQRDGWLGKLEHYDIEKFLGSGAFGVVAKAFDEKLHRIVAIKLLNPELATISPPRKRFIREARAAASISQENVVAIYAVEEEPTPYLVLEYVPGPTLKEHMDSQGPLDLAEVIAISKQVAKGLAAAHETNVVHRDIKPANIMLFKDGGLKAKITDFGLARAVDDFSLTRSGVISGTPMFMAPEQARGETLDSRTDLFSLGSMMYQMIGGRPPFRAANTIALLKRVCDDTPRSLSDVMPGTPDWIETIVSKLMEKSREDRFQTAAEVANLLEDCEHELKQARNVTCVSHLSKQKLAVRGKNKIRFSIQHTKASGWFFGVAIVAVLILGLTFLAKALNKDTSNPVQPANNVASKLADNSQLADSDTSPGTDTESKPEPAIAPFLEEEAKQYQQDWAQYLNVPLEYENSIGMRFRLIPPGEFDMGSTDVEIDRTLEIADLFWRERIQSTAPQHRVRLTQPFYIGVTEVTQEQYRLVMQTNPAFFSKTGEGRDVLATDETGDLPVERVSWNDAAEFCARLSEQEKRKPFYARANESVTLLPGNGYRLPTEAEWEYACRAGTTSPFFNGPAEVDLSAVAWFAGQSGGRTHLVESLDDNPFGLFGSHGNVWEWVQDGWVLDQYSRLGDQVVENPSIPFEDETDRGLRGGSWFDSHYVCGSAIRHASHPTTTLNYIGFRVVLMLEKNDETTP
ncbi:MAG: bifunctional serine/threonine-protein kinase/formylglycine-generating enzyme family protein [Rubripirellula sp.]